MRALLLVLPQLFSFFFFFVLRLSLSPALAVNLLPLMLSSCFLLASRRVKKRPKERPRPNGQLRAEAAAAVAATVTASCSLKPGAGIPQGASLLISRADFSGAANVPGVHVHVKHI
jgi:hypothetical protein